MKKEDLRFCILKDDDGSVNGFEVISDITEIKYIEDYKFYSSLIEGGLSEEQAQKVVIEAGEAFPGSGTIGVYATLSEENNFFCMYNIKENILNPDFMLDQFNSSNSDINERKKWNLERKLIQSLPEKLALSNAYNKYITQKNSQ
jgi:hypothetical protein